MALEWVWGLGVLVVIRVVGGLYFVNWEVNEGVEAE